MICDSLFTQPLINDNLFTFQPKDEQYQQIKDILVKGGDDWFLFPQQHIKLKHLLINKNGINVNLIRTNENGEFKTEIEFGNQYLTGCMSDDGQYLITQDVSSSEIQIRKQIEI